MFVLIALCGLGSISAQEKISGTVVAAGTGEPLAGVSVSAGRQGTVTGENGGFYLTVSENAAISFSFTGYKSQTIKWQGGRIRVELERINLMLQPVEIKAIRAGERAPFAKTNLDKKEIRANNPGWDLPFILNQTPSVVANSDAGNGVGYTGIRIRGSDASRINVTLNGIPYNDAESQGVFFVDLPDFASSVNSIQIQRGAGTSSNGAGAFGATINMSTNEFNEKKYAEIITGAGSFNTLRHTVKAGTGLLNDHFTLDLRFSRIRSDGFIDRASSRLGSVFGSAAYWSKKASLRFNAFTGKEKTYQAWYGVPENLLHTNRTFNSAGTEKPGSPYENETDNFLQNHYQFFYNQEAGRHWQFSMAAFYTRGKGYYEQYRANASLSDYGLNNIVQNGNPVTGSDLVRQLWLDNHFYGGIYSFIFKNNSHQFTLGGGYTEYRGKHYGIVTWAQNFNPAGHRWYNLDADKKDFNLYLKEQIRLNDKWELFADLQYRRVNYAINGFRNNPALLVNNNWAFFNPKAGISYKQKDWTAYLSYSIANKEPNREDFEAGNNRQPLHENLHDLEAGFEKKFRKAGLGANLFYMRYRNQLVLTGQINDVGAYTRTNIPRSYRLGIEIQGSLNPLPWLKASANIAFSRNKVLNFTEFVDDYDNGGQKSFFHASPDIAFSPGVVGSANISITPFRGTMLSFISKYVGKQYLDNTQNESRSLRAFYVQDARISQSLKFRGVKEVSVSLLVNNLFNLAYEPNGYTFSYLSNGALTTENFYFPMAGRNFWMTVAVGL